MPELVSSPITYTEEATASGSLGGIAFTNADIVLSMTGDATNVTRVISRSGSIIDSNSGTVTVSVAGPMSVMSATLTGHAGVFHNLGSGAIAGNVGFDGEVAGSTSPSTDFIIFSISSVLASLYDLKTSIGPLSGPAQITDFAFATTGGDLILNNIDSPATFTATTSGTVAGDPHFTTYDGLRYDFQVAGDFVLTRSTVPGNSFDVQVRTKAPDDGSAVTIVSEVAAKLGDHRVTFDLDRATAGGSFVCVDGQPISSQMDKPTLILEVGRIVEISPGHDQVIWNTGEILDVTNAGTYLNATSWLSPKDGPGSVEGMLGSDRGWQSDFKLADGTFLDPQTSTRDLHGVFADAWRVTGATSLLDAVQGPATLRGFEASALPVFV